MLTAIVLINVERAKLKTITKDILSIDGVAELHTIAGEYDLAAIIKATDTVKLSDIVVDKLVHHIPGIIHTKTFVALQSDIKHS
jgi:DNA-binding Lrp family transcriptional regulator